jgi:alkylhydroperoxidase/carboxymuconolactone decarboxylase family protein YurZ
MMGWAVHGTPATGAITCELPMTTSEEILRRLTIGDPAYCRTLMATDAPGTARGLDSRSRALLRLGGVISAGSADPLWHQSVGDALDAGLSFDEIVGSLTLLAPSIGIERVVEVAPHLARALGYDVEAALERLDGDAAPAVIRQPRPRATDA